MTKKWNYHDVSEEMLNTSLIDLREEYNIILMPLADIPIDRYTSNSD